MRKGAWKIFPGYVTVKLEGVRIERFLSEVSTSCRLYGVKRSSYTALQVRVKGGALNHFLREAERSGVRTEIVKKSRAYSVMEGIARRWWILACAAAAAAILWYASGYCFSIEINGIKELNEFAVNAVAAESGAQRFKRKEEIDLFAVERALYRAFPQIAYADAKFDGTKLILTIGEGGVMPEMLSTEPCSIAAEKDAVITEIVVGAGKAAVAPGDVVKAGDILIKGAYLVKETPFTVAARGTVKATVDYYGAAEAEVKNSVLTETGERAQVRMLIVGGLRIPIEGKNPFALYKEKSEKSVRGLLGTELVTYYECVQDSKACEELAKKEAEETAYFRALADIPETAEVTSIQTYSEIRGGKAEALVIVTTQEDIGVKVPVGNIENPLERVPEEEPQT